MPGKLTAAHLIEQLNQDTPMNQLVEMGTRINQLDAYGAMVVKYSIDADRTTAVTAFTAPFACEVIDVLVIARATSGSGTVTLRKATSAITDAIIMAADNVATRMGTHDDANATLAKADTLTVIANGAADRGDVYITIKKV